MKKQLTSSLLLTMLACLTISSGTRAQFHWHITRSGFDGRYFSLFYPIASAGEVVTATCQKTDTSLRTVNRNRIVFLRSTDAGETWMEQDPGLPHHKGDFPLLIQALQQIDSLNAVAVGDTGIIVRTTDGGSTWIRQDLHTLDRISAVHFSDPATGIAITSRIDPHDSMSSVSDIYTTHNGGKEWDKAPVSTWLWSVTCHSDGGNVFRVIPYGGYGPIYRTTDNWNSYDTTAFVLPWADRDHLLTGFRFRGSDTIVGYGVQGPIQGYLRPIDVRLSLNGGTTWNSTVGMPDTNLSNSYSMSQLDRDFVFLGAMIPSNEMKIGVSTDHGVSWRLDKIAMDTNFLTTEILDVTTTPAGHAIAIFRGGISHGGGQTIQDQFVLVRGDPPKARVETFERIVNKAAVYPNPAFDAVTIASLAIHSPVRILDVMGREVLHGFVPAAGELRLDVSQLPRGMYQVMIERDGQMIPVGKLALVGK
ncbi:MAG: T9SS type A sorting domain-containing protein [Bacteroidota bacterium]|nr:T9SS type A sorting domain-containing protein [Bacteroidota bacterium]